MNSTNGKLVKGRLLREWKTLLCMTRIYCADHHSGTNVDTVGAVGRNSNDLCSDCEKLMNYASRRLEKCPYGEDKPTCAKCPIHCYKAIPREQVRTIMRYSGPKMLLRHPLRALTHLYDQCRRVEHPMKLRNRNPGRNLRRRVVRRVSEDAEPRP